MIPVTARTPSACSARLPAMPDTPTRLRDCADALYVAAFLGALFGGGFYLFGSTVRKSVLIGAGLTLGLWLNFVLPERVLSYQPHWIVWLALIALLFYFAWPVALCFIALTSYRFAVRAWRGWRRARPVR